ncbi:hypothetical protein [Rhodobacter sp. 24-YEA-8]|nr:hypothetical protein [Rhodobacter sp. 24-YEA-8]
MAAFLLAPPVAHEKRAVAAGVDMFGRLDRDDIAQRVGVTRRQRSRCDGA